MPEPITMKFGMYIMPPEPISKAYFTYPSHQSMCLYKYPPIVARQRLGKNFHGENKYTRRNRRIVGGVVLCAVFTVVEESRRLVLPRTSCLLHDVKNNKYV
jgi:hypothetical protein